MGLFDFFKKKNEPQITLKDLIIVDYKPIYKNECEYIREHYMPEEGASEVLQGELLREIELLRKEAKENGNKNWDMDFSYICENIKWKLCNMSIYSEEECLKVNLIIDYLKYTGEYAGNNAVDREGNSIAYTRDNLYDILADLVGKLQNIHPEPIDYEMNYSIQK